MHYTIVNASPLTESRSASITKLLAQKLARRQDAIVEVLEIGTHPVCPCTACDGCRNAHPCVIDDAMQGHYGSLDAADVLIIVTPVYFAGPPAQFKAFLDRLQPYYYGREHPEEKRAAYLLVVREGGDPHGFDPLVTSTRSALAVVGFKIEKTFDYLGMYDDELIELTDTALVQIG